jgi:threonyl-tRNA synthetase
MEKVPYILVVGEREARAKSVSVRRKGQGDQGVQKVDDFIAEIKQEISKKA